MPEMTEFYHYCPKCRGECEPAPKGTEPTCGRCGSKVTRLARSQTPVFGVPMPAIEVPDFEERGAA